MITVSALPLKVYEPDPIHPKPKYAFSMTQKTIAEALSDPTTKVAHSEDKHVNHISPIAKHKDLLLRLLGPLTIGLFIWHTLEQACDTKPYDTHRSIHQ